MHFGSDAPCVSNNGPLHGLTRAAVQDVVSCGGWKSHALGNQDTPGNQSRKVSLLQWV